MIHKRGKTIPRMLPLKRGQRRDPVYYVVSDLRKEVFIHSLRWEGRVTHKKYTDTCEDESTLKLSSDNFPYFLRKKEEILSAETVDGRRSRQSLKGDDNV